MNVANGAIEPICDPSVTTCTFDLAVQATAHSAYLVADVTGYFRRGGQTIAVNCPGQSLQAAVNTAQPGDIINVTGTCNENITILEDKTRLTLDGQNVATINGSVNANTVAIQGKGILIQNFTINGGSYGVLERRTASAIINHNIIQNATQWGISMSMGSFAIITNNTIQNNANGIYIGDTSNGRIGFATTSDSAPSPNTIQNNGGYGIEVMRGASAHIVSNTIAGNGSDGIGVFRLSQADIDGNTINNNTGNGINVGTNSGIQLGENNPGTNFFYQPNTTTVNNLGYGINCGMGAYVQGHLGSTNQIMGNSGQTTNPWPGSCPQSLVTP